MGFSTYVVCIHIRVIAPTMSKLVRFLKVRKLIRCSPCKSLFVLVHLLAWSSRLTDVTGCYMLSDLSSPSFGFGLQTIEVGIFVIVGLIAYLYTEALNILSFVLSGISVPYGSLNIGRQPVTVAFNRCAVNHCVRKKNRKNKMSNAWTETNAISIKSGGK